MICTFFGHRECYGLDTTVLQAAIEDLIQSGVDTFYVGHQGSFDDAVLSCLRRLQNIYPQIRFSVVLAYLPQKVSAYDRYADCSIYPEGLEIGPPRFAIERRNKWMIAHSDVCLCWINFTWGGAYKFARLAKRHGLRVRNFGSALL